MKLKRHLHRDYFTTFCGKDASHIPATWKTADATCVKCAELGKAQDKVVRAQLKRMVREQAAQVAREAEASAERAKQHRRDAGIERRPPGQVK